MHYYKHLRKYLESGLMTGSLSGRVSGLSPGQISGYRLKSCVRMLCLNVWQGVWCQWILSGSFWGQTDSGNLAAWLQYKQYLPGRFINC